VETFRYLGLEPNLNADQRHGARWVVQLAAQCRSAYRTFHELTAAAQRLPFLSPAVMMSVFTTYCAPKAEFGAQIWAPFLTASQRAALDHIQNAYQMQLLLPNATAAMATSYAFASGEFARVSASAHCDTLALRYLH